MPQTQNGARGIANTAEQEQRIDYQALCSSVINCQCLGQVSVKTFKTLTINFVSEQICNITYLQYYDDTF
jgi:hypothetical protein